MPEFPFQIEVLGGGEYWPVEDLEDLKNAADCIVSRTVVEGSPVEREIDSAQVRMDVLSLALRPTWALYWAPNDTTYRVTPKLTQTERWARDLSEEALRTQLGILPLDHTQRAVIEEAIRRARQPIDYA